MKKLLGLLGAIGLIGSSSAAVVACGDPATEETTTKYDLSKLSISLIEGTSQTDAEAAISAAIKAASSKAVVTTDYTIAYETGAVVDSKLVVGKKITVAAAGTSTLLSGTKSITVVEKADLSELDVKLSVGVSKSDADAAIVAAISKLAAGAAVTTDYTIAYGDGALTGAEGSQTLVAGKTVTVAAVGTSKLVKNSKVITIEKLDISSLKVSLTPGMSQTDAEAAISAAIGVGAVVSTDYTIAYEDGALAGETGSQTLVAGKKVTVTAKSDSTLISGELVITIEKLDISTLKVSLTTGMSEADANTAIGAAIGVGAVVSKDYTIAYEDGALAGETGSQTLVAGKKVTVTAKSDSTLISGELVITVTAISSDSVISKKALGNINGNTEEVIYAAVLAANNEKISEDELKNNFDVKYAKQGSESDLVASNDSDLDQDKSRTSATLVPKTDKYSGNVVVTYNFNTNSLVTANSKLKVADGTEISLSGENGDTFDVSKAAVGNGVSLTFSGVVNFISLNDYVNGTAYLNDAVTVDILLAGTETNLPDSKTKAFSIVGSIKLSKSTVGDKFKLVFDYGNQDVATYYINVIE